MNPGSPETVEDNCFTMNTWQAQRLDFQGVGAGSGRVSGIQLESILANRNRRIAHGGRGGGVGCDASRRAKLEAESCVACVLSWEI